MSDTRSNPPVALITGAARRLGAAMARMLHAEGFDLVLHYHQSGDAAESLQRELEQQRANSVRLVPAQLEAPMEVRNLARRALQAFGRVDVLINNASQFFPTPLAQTDDTQWDRIFGANLQAPFLLAQCLMESLREQHGCILNMADIYAQRPLRNHSLYCASKAALVSLTQSLALELAPEVRVNAIAPGAILWPEATPTSNVEQVAQQNQQEAILSKVALGRLGSVEDIARAARFLILEAPYVTGQVLSLDGGRSLTI